MSLSPRMTNDAKLKLLNENYDKLKGLEALYLEYKDAKTNISSLAAEIEQLKTAVDESSRQDLEKMLELAQQKLALKSDEIKKHGLDACVFKSAREFVSVANQLDDAAMEGIAREYMNQTMTSFSIVKQTAEQLFSKKFSTQHVKLVKIKKEVETALQEVKASHIIQQEYKERIIAELGDILLNQITLYENEDHIAVVLDAEYADTVETQINTRQAYVPLSAQTKEGQIACLFYECSKYALSKVITETDYGMCIVKECINSLAGTSSSVANPDEWILDVVMKKLIEISKNRETLLASMNFDSDIIGSGVFSMSYTILKNCLQRCGESLSLRQEKAKKIARGCSEKYFKCNECKNVKALFVQLAEMRDFIESSYAREYCGDLATRMEDIRAKIAHACSRINLDLHATLISNKAYLAGVVHEFGVCVQMITHHHDSHLLKVAFFDAFYSTILGQVFVFSAWDAVSLAALIELLEYAISQGLYEKNVEETRGFYKLNEFLDLLKGASPVNGAKYLTVEEHDKMAAILATIQK
ncbi:hypothetical protein ENBRE01_0440 [Enteropsectra breve]|nr:hypothetical protein ENBRE01_0440 [Enteropsectra breve]